MVVSSLIIILLTLILLGIAENYYHNRSLRRIPIRIVRVEFDVEAGGAKYTCIAVAAESIAFDDRFKFPRTQITIDKGYWKDWKQEIEKNCEKLFRGRNKRRPQSLIILFIARS